MPNTLAHLGLAGLLTRGVLRDVDLRWVYIGAIISDLPWILPRRFRTISPGLDLLDLRLYVIVQATLFFSLILSAAFALMSTFPLKNFFVLGFGSFVHLFLDAFQIKRANGVHFFAPFDWRLTQFAFFWPDSIPTYFITALGFLYLLLNWKKSAQGPWPLQIKAKRQVCGAVMLLGLYFLLPLALMRAPEAKNNHFAKTLREVDARPGKPIEFDRAFYRHDPSPGKLLSFHGEVFEVVGLRLDHSGLISIRGVFIDQNTVQVKDYNLHSSYFRDNVTYVGLALIVFLWAWSGFLSFGKVR